MQDFAVFHFKPELCVPMNIHVRPRTPVVPLPRCKHHVYDPDGNGRAFHCGLCRLQNYAKPTNGFSFPHNSGNPFSENRLHANSHEPGSCPACGSRIHTDESRTKWKCADCGEVFKHPKSQPTQELVAA